MKISTPKRLNKENVKAEDQVLLDVIGGVVNDFTDEIYVAMNKNITVDDNLNMQYKTLSVSINSTGIPKTPTQFKSTLTTKSKGILVVQTYNNTNINNYLLGAPFVTYSENSGLITILHITGLVPDNSYTLTLLNLG